MYTLKIITTEGNFVFVQLSSPANYYDTLVEAVEQHNLSTLEKLRAVLRLESSRARPCS